MHRPLTPPDEENHVNPLKTQLSNPPVLATSDMPPPKEPLKKSPDRYQMLRRQGARRLARYRSDRKSSPPLLPQPLPPPRRRGLSEETTDSSDELDSFATTLPFTLTFHTISYPGWAREPHLPLRYFPVPLAPLPGIPSIPAEISICFNQILDPSMFADTIDGILEGHGYASLSRYDAWKVYVGFTHANGKRQNIAVSVDNVELIVRPWAKAVWKSELSGVSLGCQCEDCQGGKSSMLGHGLEVKVVFPEGTEAKRTLRYTDRQDRIKFLDQRDTMWAGTERLPARRAPDVDLAYERRVHSGDF